ncbi:MAG: DUF4139 domain-containing protein [Chitinophagaceae bacterium]
MKLYIAILSLAFSASLGAQTIKTIKPKPDKAMVYLYGAELSYNEVLTLAPGANEIVIEGVAADLDENSISAYFKGAMVIDTRKSVRYPESPKTIDNYVRYKVIIDRISDSLDDISFLIRDCNNKNAALDKEKYLLFNNRLMRGEFAKDSIALLKSSLDLLRARQNNIDEEKLALDKKLYRYNKMQTKLNERLEHYQLVASSAGDIIDPSAYKAIYQIIVSVEAEAAVTGNLNLKYYVASAGWLPRYDIMATSGKEKIQLIYRAQVYQNTGIDWKDVNLTLSTSNPNQGNTKPVLNTWNLFYGYPNSYLQNQNAYGYKVPSTQNYNMAKPEMKTKKLSVQDNAQTEDLDDAGATMAEPVFTINDNLMRAEYVIKTKYSIASDNKSHNVVINNVEVPVTLTYSAVPKLDKDAFLMGKVVNWEDLNLLPANAKLFFDDSYIGLTAIDPNTVKDTLYMDLGRDRSIIVKRQNLKDKCKDQVIGDDHIVTKTIEITVRNTKTIALDFEVEDQIPVASDNTIKVNLLNKDGAIYNELTGKLTWKISVKPKDSKKIVFSYEVRYPKGKYIGTLQ